MNRTQSLEIELHEATINNNMVDVSYTIYDGELAIEDKTERISRNTLRLYINNNGLNEYCVDVLIGDYDTLDSADYLTENLNQVVLQYLTETI